MEPVPSDVPGSTGKRRWSAGLVLVAGGLIAGIYLVPLAETRGVRIAVAALVFAGIAYLALGGALMVTRGQLSHWVQRR